MFFNIIYLVCQVAEVMVYRRKKNGDLPRYVESLVSSLFNRLDLSADQVYVQRHREGLAKVGIRL